MSNNGNLMDETSHLVLHRTPRSELQKGITVISKAKGAYVFDRAGNRYLDLNAGATRPVHVGYGREEIAQAVYDQCCELSYYTPCMFANEPAIKLAELLSEIAPPPIDRFTFECDGSEAVESAMKLAKHHHYYNGNKGRYKIISRVGAYHGVNGIGVRALGVVLPMRQMMEPIAPGGVFAQSPYCYRCPYNLSYPNCDIACARAVEKVIEFEDPDLVSAFIGEPIQQGFGAYRPPREYWSIIREVCDKYGILLIIDEVICGFGRTGKMFGIQHFDIKPNLLTMAKGLTSGYVPLGAVGCSNKVIEPIETFMHIHTYGNHPVSCAAGIKNLQILKEEKLVENSEKMGAYFLEKLQEFTSHPTVGEVRGTGLWLAIDFTTDKKTRAPFPAERLNNIITRARRKGLLTRFMGPALEFAPPLIIQKDEIDEAVRILNESISEEEKDMGL
ncbi:MAG: aspartate aminotransferase family protein [Deltaproteobacteria bacterium]|nr:aspartate aminotransferase family protein [Deltaproteobacteria bacterium]